MEDGSGNTQAERPSQLSSGHKKGGSADYKTANALAPSISNMKDAVAYFGLRGVFGKRKVR